MLLLIDNGHGADNLTAGKCSPPVAAVSGIPADDPTLYAGRFREGNFNRLVAAELVRALKDGGICAAELLVPERADVSLRERADRVNARCRVLGTHNVALVSIHGNALGNGDRWLQADYWTVWTSKGQTRADALADRIWLGCKQAMPDRKFGKQTVPDGDVDYESKFYILVKTLCPAVLTENFFFDNQENLRFMASPAGRSLIVKGHADGIRAWIDSISK